MNPVKSRSKAQGSSDVEVEDEAALEEQLLSHPVSVGSMLTDLGFDDQYIQGSMQWYLAQFQQIVSTIASWFDQGIINLGELIQSKPQLDFVFTRTPSAANLPTKPPQHQKTLHQKQKQHQQISTTPEDLIHSYIPNQYFTQLQYLINPQPQIDPKTLFKNSNSNSNSNLNSNPNSNLNSNFLEISDPTNFFNSPWELIIDETRPGIRYRAYRRPLRKGLYIYKTSQIYAYTTVDEVSAFNVNKEFREEWDTHTYKYFNIIEGQGEEIEGQKDAVMYMRTRYPGPMADREFVAARRFWREGGNTYCLSVSVDYDVDEVVGVKRGRIFKVDDYLSCYVVRPVVDELTGAPSPIDEVEFLGIYYEDPGVSSGLVNLIIKKGLWSATQKHEQALRLYQKWNQAQKNKNSPKSRKRSMYLDHHQNQQDNINKQLKQSLKFCLSRKDGRCVLKIDSDRGCRSTQKSKKITRVGAAAVLGLTVLSKIIKK